jgi:Leucine-rich repeat (LRR) protein
MKSLKTIRVGPGTQDFQPDSFWKKYDAGEFGKPITTFKEPAFIQWAKDVAALPAEDQVKAVSKKLVELNPGFDGKVTGAGANATPKIEKGVVTELGFLPDNVTDISPVRALVGLSILDCTGHASGKGALSDLSPLQGLTLSAIWCGYTQVSDLTPLKGMKLTSFACDNTRVSDLSPLKGMPLSKLSFSVTQISDLSPLDGMKLTTLNCAPSLVSDLSPLQGMTLTTLNCGPSLVSDLSPLKGMPLGNLFCLGTKISDLSPLISVPTLSRLNVQNTKVTPAQVAALQKALPNCKIEWDDPAKPKTPEPAASGTK